MKQPADPQMVVEAGDLAEELAELRSKKHSVNHLINSI